MKRLQDRQRGNFGADPLCQGDAVLGSLPGEFRPIGRYQEVGVHRSLLLAPSCASELSPHLGSRVRVDGNSCLRSASVHPFGGVRSVQESRSVRSRRSSCG